MSLALVLVLASKVQSLVLHGIESPGLGLAILPLTTSLLFVHDKKVKKYTFCINHACNPETQTCLNAIM